LARLGGIDGCSAGWLCVELDTLSGTVGGKVLASPEDLSQAMARLDLLTIDIPIGLPEAGPRSCDLAARRLLAPRRSSSVFPAPVRAALDGRSWLEACALSAAACGKRLSRQTFAILDRIRDVDELMRSAPGLQARVREIHPELCFYYLNAEEVVPDPKRTASGREQRQRLLDRGFGSAFTSLRSRLHRGAAADDDILDALAALWTTRRIWEGTVVTIPTQPEHDRYGLRMEMLA
jgi:predicted RNase H-like nuclease